MLTNAQAWNDQQNLNILCEDREPDAGNETYNSNAFYGNVKVLRQYAQYKGRIDMVIQHGVQLGEIWRGEADAIIPVYCWQPSNAGKYRKRFVLGAAPFLYALALLEDSDQARGGTIFFPAHSTEHVNATMDTKALARKLKTLPRTCHPVTVCLYWKDFRRGMAEHYKGFRIVSAGHMFDVDFLYRLAYLLKAHKYAASNSIGSHVFYSVATGCEYFHLPHEFDFDCGDEGLLIETRESKKGQGAKQMTSWIMENLNSRDWCKRFIGSEYFRTPEGLMEQLSQ